MRETATGLYRRGSLMDEGVDEELEVEKLTSGDRPSILMFGLVGAQAIRSSKMAVFMVDALGRVRIMPTGAVKVLIPPKISDEDLDRLEEDQAIQVKVIEGE